MKTLHCTLGLGLYRVKVYKDEFEGDECRDFGEYDEHTQEIHINKDIDSQEVFADTLFHECVEAVNAVFGLELPHQAIQTLGVGLAQMLGPRLNLEPDKLTFNNNLPLHNGDGD